MSRFINININVGNTRMTYIVKRRKYYLTILGESSVSQPDRYLDQFYLDWSYTIYLHVQKLLFLDKVDGDSSVLRQHWSELTQGRARVIKAHSSMIEIVPLNASKGGGIRILLDHLGITEDVCICFHQRKHLPFSFCA
jgi:hydroxymethylpyrimidine pyrophosphatase-like HAD family hydrolase